jgi:DNA-3-methyladenine glycosylase
MGNKLSEQFYTDSDVVEIARNLLGKQLVTHINGNLSSGVIVETEAYNGRTDRACHAFGGRRTARTETMYQAGGVAYVYLCYGIHNLFNVVTHQQDYADAVLIRAIAPQEGKELMLQRRNMSQIKPRITAGPGCVTQALGIDRSHDNISLLEETIWIEDRGLSYTDNEIEVGPRVGVGYAKEDALLPWRFWVKENRFVSKARPVYP